jgi:hypothetical protein
MGFFPQISHTLATFDSSFDSKIHCTKNWPKNQLFEENRLCRRLLEFSGDDAVELEGVLPTQGDFFPVIDDNVGDLIGFEQIKCFQEYSVFSLPGPIKAAGVDVDQYADDISEQKFFDLLGSGIEFPMTIDLGSLKLRHSEIFWLENHMVGVVQAPVPELNSLLPDHFMVKFSAR